jgi:hypothetical protein
MGRIGGVGLPSRASMFEDLLEHEMFEPHPRARDDGLEIELTMGKRGRSPNWTVCCCQDVAICTASMDETQTHAMRYDLSLHNSITMYYYRSAGIFSDSPLFGIFLRQANMGFRRRGLPGVLHRAKSRGP